MNQTRKKLVLTIVFISIFLGLFGIYMIYEASNIWANFKYNDSFYFLKRQIIYFIIGMFMFFIGYKIPLHFFKKYSVIFLIVTYILLGLVLIPGVGLIRGGSASWLGYGMISFQPSEVFKLSLITFLAVLLENKYYKTDHLSIVIKVLIFAFFGFGLILLQPDFGTCMVLAVAVFGMIFVTKLPKKYFVMMMGIGLVGVVIMIMTAAYRLQRMFSFIDPFSDPLGSGFQILQSLYAIGPGGLLGKGESYQKYYYLPEPQTDFIFAIIVEEFSLIGGLILISLYAILFYSIYKLIRRNNTLFKTYLDLGLLILFLVQVIINLGVVIGLFPVTGITLPLISYGGSSLCVLYFSLGLIIHKEEKI